jgi:hypothetical protein
MDSRRENDTSSLSQTTSRGGQRCTLYRGGCPSNQVPLLCPERAAQKLRLELQVSANGSGVGIPGRKQDTDHFSATLLRVYSVTICEDG